MKRKSLYTGTLVLATIGFIQWQNLMVINHVDDKYVYISDTKEFIIPVELEKSAIQNNPDLLAWIVINVYCQWNEVFIENIDENTTKIFNKEYEKILNRVISYDTKFLAKLQTVYTQLPVENYIVKALLSNTISFGEFQDITYNTKPWNFSLNTQNNLCNNKPELNPLGKDWHFISRIWTDLTKNTPIIARHERNADETLSKPYPPKKNIEERPTQQGEPDPTNQMIRTNYLINFNDQDEKKTIKEQVNPERRALEYFPADRIIIHHTASKLARTAEEGAQYMRNVHKYHWQTLWRGDIWYHFLIDWAGNIYEWRRWWMYSVWAHVLWHNRGSIGISLISDWEYPGPMLVSLVKLIVFLANEYNIDITQNWQFKNRNLTGLENSPAVVAHKELTSRKPYDPMIDMNIFRAILKKAQEKWISL